MPEILILILAGCLGGFMNTIASSGSAITLPVMIFLGIPPSIANATNRLPILLGSSSSVYSFAKKDLIDWRSSMAVTFPWLLGCVFGIISSNFIHPKNLQTLILFALVFAFILIVSNARVLLQRESSPKEISKKNHLLFFLIGLWAGLIVLDCATLILFELILGCGMDLTRANPIKNFLLLLLSLISVLIFALNHSINWEIGGALSAGSIVGSKLAVVLNQNRKVRVWVFGFLIVIMLTEIIHLIFKSYLNLDFFPLNHSNSSNFKL